MTKKKKNSLFYVKIFLVFFAAILLIAVIIRIYSSYTSRQFTQNSFNILIISDKYVGVVGIDDGDKRINSVIVTENLDSIKKRNILIQSINFGIPIHAYIAFSEGVEVQNPTKTFFSFGSIKNIFMNPAISKKNISFFDWIKLYSLSKNIDENRVHVKAYATITDLSKLLSHDDETFFRNSDLVKRKTSLQIINGTKINGLGNRVGDMFSRFGFNVVSVTTNSFDKSIVYYSEESSLKDALLIAKSFDLPVEKSNKHVLAAVTLIIGEESELLLEDLAY